MTKKKPNLKLRQYRNLLLLLFLIMILIVPLVHLALPDREFSAVENRALKQPPAFSMAALQDGSYKKDLTSYMEDQFPFRDQMIRLKAGIEKLLGRQENNDVYIRSTEYLMDKFNPNSKELTKEKAEVLNAFAKAHSTQKVSLMFRLEDIKIPSNFDYDKVKSLSFESKEKFKNIRPATISQASRISGVSPTDISILLVHMGRWFLV